MLCTFTPIMAQSSVGSSLTLMARVPVGGGGLLFFALVPEPPQAASVNSIAIEKITSARRKIRAGLCCMTLAPRKCKLCRAGVCSPWHETHAFRQSSDYQSESLCFFLRGFHEGFSKVSAKTWRTAFA